MTLRWSDLLFSLCLRFAADEPRWLVLNRASREALAAKDYAGLRETLLELKPLLPGNPRVVYNLAVANARLGDAGSALAGLQDLANMGLIYDLSSSVDFLPLRSSPGFAAIVSRMEENKAPVSHSRPAFSLEERDLLPEDIACDPATRRFFVAGVRASKIITVDGHDFAKTDWPVLALRADSRHGHGIVSAASDVLPFFISLPTQPAGGASKNRRRPEMGSFLLYGIRPIHPAHRPESTLQPHPPRRHLSLRPICAPGPTPKGAPR